MNSNIENLNLSPPTFFFANELSPYLSPLYGSASSLQQYSHDELNDFKLQENQIQIIGGEIDHQIIDASLSQILFRPSEQQPNQSIQIQVKFQDKHEIKTPNFLPTSNKTRIYQIINLLSSNDLLPEQQLISIGKPLYENSKQFQFIFKTLLTKFTKLRKTKEQMVKYCMRKAFKFIGDHKRIQKNLKQKKQKGQKKSQNELILSMPFRKNSVEKTMNSQYLKQVFSSFEFVKYYKQFLNQIQSIIKQDNNSKIQYLSQTIQKLIQNNRVSEVQKIKRLPWNQTILKKTQSLAKNLIEFANSNNSQIHFNENEKDQQIQSQN